MNSDKFPHGMTWGDIFCRGSSACGAPYHWNHILNADGKCSRCDYTMPAELANRLEKARAGDQEGHKP